MSEVTGGRDGVPLTTHSPHRPIRLALYGHDTQGLGHLRRNLRIADAFARGHHAPQTLICAGVAEARAFALPSGVDLVTLPGLRKDANGTYRARSLGLRVDDLVALRADILEAALVAFDPDVLVVDKVALGALREMEPALRALHRAGRCRMALGLRDILDAPRDARREWLCAETTQAVRTYYDALWVYGDPAVADPVAECRLPADVAAKVSFSGYLTEGRRPSEADGLTDSILARGPYVLCVVGGGQDGVPLARAFLDAPLPNGVRGVVITGPFMDAAERAKLEAAAEARPGREVYGFVTEPSWLVRGATAVAAMAGYNTVCELLEAEVPTLLVPRTRPRREQQIRAERLAAMGCVECLLPQEATPAALGAALERLVHRPTPPPCIDLSGVSRLPGMLESLLAVPGPRGVAHVAS